MDTPKKFQAITKSADTGDWPGDMSLEAYQKAIPLDQESVYDYFFHANKENIRVQNPQVAIPKLRTILESTFRITARRGFHAMSLRDLCQDTGISMGGIYNYLGSKEELARMVTEFVGVTIVELNKPLLQATEDTASEFEAHLRAQVYMAELFRPWYFFVYMETKNLASDQIRRAIEVERAILHFKESLIQKGIEDGIYEQVDIQLTASALQTIVEDWYLKAWHFRERGLTANQYGEFVIETAHRLLGYDNGN